MWMLHMRDGLAFESFMELRIGRKMGGQILIATTRSRHVLRLVDLAMPPVPAAAISYGPSGGQSHGLWRERLDYSA
jgi:hypothetical protein